jgi:hypothetical protein
MILITNYWNTINIYFINLHRSILHYNKTVIILICVLYYNSFKLLKKYNKLYSYVNYFLTLILI